MQKFKWKRVGRVKLFLSNWSAKVEESWESFASRGELQWKSARGGHEIYWEEKIARNGGKTEQKAENWGEEERKCGGSLRRNLFFGNCIHFNDDEKKIREQFDFIYPCDLDLSVGNATSMLLKHGNFIDMETVVFNKNAAINIGGFNKKYKYNYKRRSFTKKNKVEIWQQI